MRVRVSGMGVKGYRNQLPSRACLPFLEGGDVDVFEDQERGGILNWRHGSQGVAVSGNVCRVLVQYRAVVCHFFKAIRDGGPFDCLSRWFYLHGQA